MKKRNQILTIISSLWLLPACAGEGLEEGGETFEQHNQALLVQNGTTMWNGAVPGNSNYWGNSALIDLCFAVRPVLRSGGSTDCPNQGTYTDCDGNTLTGTLAGHTPWATGSSSAVRAALRNDFRENIERTWLTHANIEVVNWGDCPINAANKHDAAALTNRIMVTFKQSDSSGWGKSSTQPTFIGLNWRAMNSVESRVDHHSDLIHEFGHALGYEHEWRRFDWTLQEGDPAANLAGDVLGTGANDWDSIMNYSTTVFELSAWDIIGVQNAYGRKSSGSLVGDWASCANVQGASTVSGTPIVSFPCRNQSNDRFARSPNHYKLESLLPDRCMSLGSLTANSPVTSRQCSSGSSFGFFNTEWRGMGKMCVERVVSGGATVLQLKTCNGSASQKWDFFRNAGGTANGQNFYQIRTPGGASCVTAQTTSGAFGEQLRVTTCTTGNTLQRFGFPGGGVISYNNNQTYCMNVGGGVPVSGSPIILWNGCGSNAPPNNRYHLHGQVRERNNNYCLEATGRGAQVVVNTCSSADRQQVWDYYL